MPYTPPSHRSPATSVSSSPDPSRRCSNQALNSSSRPQFPRSASYLTRHRRTPAAAAPPAHHHVDQLTPENTSDNLQAMVMNSTVRKSPPPITCERGMPAGAIVSPPESGASSDEDEIQAAKADAASQGADTERSLVILTSQTRVVTEGIHRSVTMSSLDKLAATPRRIAHLRSATEPSLRTMPSAASSLSESDDDSGEEVTQKPPMVRKKSGELVRPALRPPSRRRPSSMPGTPIFNKVVHFDSHLEHVRHFLQVDRPLAVSAGSSPVDHYDSDAEYPFPSEDTVARSPLYEWEIVMNNFPLETPMRKTMPVRLERVWLSHDQKCLVGSVVVNNLAYQKKVTCRFTLDYWKTTSEVAAEFVSEVRPSEHAAGQDRFHFAIKLSDLANLESKTLFFCLRYNVTGLELWDNNSGTNFQVDFHKKLFPPQAKRAGGVLGAASRPVNGLPRSNRRPMGASRPHHLSVDDEFGHRGQVDFGQNLHHFLEDYGTTGLRLKGVKSSSSLPSDNLASRLSAPSGQAFANRYDFGASLTAAVQAAKDAMGTRSDALFMKPNRRTASPVAQSGSPAATSPPKDTSPKMTATHVQEQVPLVAEATSPVPGINSSSYEELVNKYCFFGSKQSSPCLQDDGAAFKTGRFDGFDGAAALRSTRQAKATTYDTVQPTTLAAQEVNSYFSPSMTMSPVDGGASPSESPLRGFHASVDPVSSYHSSAGTSPKELTYPFNPDRFPFSGTDAHNASTAIRG